MTGSTLSVFLYSFSQLLILYKSHRRIYVFQNQRWIFYCWTTKYHIMQCLSRTILGELFDYMILSFMQMISCTRFLMHFYVRFIEWQVSNWKNFCLGDLVLIYNHCVRKHTNTCQNVYRTYYIALSGRIHFTISRSINERP